MVTFNIHHQVQITDKSKKNLISTSQSTDILSSNHITDNTITSIKYQWQVFSIVHKLYCITGQHFLSGTTLGLEIVEKIRQQTHVLSKYVQTLCSESDSEFIRVQEELTRIKNDLHERMRNLESVCKICK